MAHHHIDFNEDLAAIRRHLRGRIETQSKMNQPITAIEVGFRLCQGNAIGINFDVREKHERDGEWSNVFEEFPFGRRHWSTAYMQAERFGISFTRLDGTSINLDPGAGDNEVAAVFGKTLLEIVRDAKARQWFEALPLREDCQLEILEFDWMWEWPKEESDLGRKNLFRKIRGKLMS